MTRPASRGPRSAGAWTTLLAAAVACISQAARAAAEPADPAQLRLAEARALQQKGALREAQKLYESFLPDLEKGKDLPELGSVLNGLSQIATAQGDYDRAAARGRDAAETYRKVGDRSGQTRAVTRPRSRS